MQLFDQEKPCRNGRGILYDALLVLLLAVFGTGLLAGCQFAAGTPAPTATSTPSATGGTPIPSLGPNNIETVREAVIAKIQPAVVQINVKTAQGGGLGSGVIIDPRGYIITNNHVVQGAQSVEVVLFNGETVPAEMVGADPLDDQAVVKIGSSRVNLAVANIGDSGTLR